MPLDKLLEALKAQQCKLRNMKLAGILTESKKNTIIGFEISFAKVLTEHEQYKQFKKSNNYYRFDPSYSDDHSKPHYHIYPNKKDSELFAVNIDGTAHHRKNKGKAIPKKIADELRIMGVTIPSNNIIEMNQSADFYDEDKFFILIEVEEIES